MRRKKSPKIKAKEDAWRTFSKYIRLRDSDTTGYCICISCAQVKPWKEMDAGHLIGSRCNNILFDEELTNAQCKFCNNAQGQQVMYWKGLKARYGYHDDKFLEFHARKRITKKYTEADYKAITEKYLDKITGLCMQKGIV